MYVKLTSKWSGLPIYLNRNRINYIEVCPLRGEAPGTVAEFDPQLHYCMVYHGRRNNSIEVLEHPDLIITDGPA